jgi:cytochrome c-type biogenesis protein
MEIKVLGPGCSKCQQAGSSTALVRRVLENSEWQSAGAWFRKGAGALIEFLGFYFILTPLVS